MRSGTSAGPLRSDYGYVRSPRLGAGVDGPVENLHGRESSVVKQSQKRRLWQSPGESPEPVIGALHVRRRQRFREGDLCDDGTPVWLQDSP